MIAVFAVIGTVLNVYKKRICFLIWMITNATWIIIDFIYGVYAQSALMFVYFFLAIHGWFMWKEKND